MKRKENKVIIVKMNKNIIIGIGIVIVLVLVMGFFLFGPNGLFKTFEDSRESSGFQESVEEEIIESDDVRWVYDGRRWKAKGGTPPECPEQIIKQTPADITLATSINYPGVWVNGDYKPHGGFGFENLKPDDITVYVPQDGFVIGGVRYIQEGELQYLFDFSHPCGIRYRLDHLLELSPKFQEKLLEIRCIDV